MNAYNRDANECVDPDDKRDRRALEEYLTVVSLDGTPIEDDETVVQVVSQSGESYHVDTDAGVCSCADYKHREPEGGCKHVRRARAATGKTTVDVATLRDLDVDPQLGIHASGPRVATSDGGIVDGDTYEQPTVREAVDDAEILEDDGEVVDLADVTGDADPDESAQDVRGDVETDDRPDDCQCEPFLAEEPVGLPCWPCYRDGFRDPHPDVVGEVLEE